MPSPTEPFTQLTSREREVANLVVKGLSSTAIATRLGLSPHTVRKHRANLMARLGVQHRAQLAALLRGSDSAAPNACPHGR